LFALQIDKYRFEDRLYKAVMRALDPYLGIATQNNDLHDVNSTDEYEYNKIQAGVHHDQIGFYNKPGKKIELKLKIIRRPFLYKGPDFCTKFDS